MPEANSPSLASLLGGRPLSHESVDCGAEAMAQCLNLGAVVYCSERKWPPGATRGHFLNPEETGEVATEGYVGVLVKAEPARLPGWDQCATSLLST